MSDHFPPLDDQYHVPGRFAGQVLVVTGAATGIGRATARRAAREGARVLLADLNEAAAAEGVAAIRADGGEARFVRTDVTRPEDADRMVADAVGAWGRLDAAINCAGVMDGGGDDGPAPLHEATEGYLRRTIEVNLFGTVYACRAEIRQFLAQGGGGAIVNVGSVTGLTGTPGTPAYVASKHGVNGLTRALAIDYAPYGIRVNSANMAATDTPMVERAVRIVRAKRAARGAEGNMVRPELKSKALIPRDATPAEQAAVLLFLASREASDVTGALVASDGGWTAF